ncbi:restriction endonuclease subunit S [Nocardioides kribbensis]|uniref:Restriction endonuclease subunit S n=1 Tax=Nocardioides kribbensis TaxID=305517 RepID=A0ABV1P2J9_9ACTN
MSRRDHWELTRLKHIVDCNAGTLPEDSDPDLSFTYVDIGNVTQGDLVLESEPTRFADAPSRARRLAVPGDTVVSTVRTYLRAVATVPENDDLLVFSTGFAVLHPRPVVDPRFLAYYLQGDEFVDRVVASSTGVSYPAITATELVRFDVRLPNLSEQEAIASYLNRETAKIDALIREQIGMVEVLRERRSAVITHACDVDAGVFPMRRAIERIRQGSSPNCEPWSTDGVTEWAVLKAGCSNTGRFRPDENKRLPEGEHPRADFVVKRGEVVMSRSNTKELVGSASVVTGDYPRLMLSDLTYGITFRPHALPTYVAYALGSARSRWAISSMSKGTSPSMQKISQTDIGDIPLALPSIEEQRRIADHLDQQTEAIDALIVDAEGVVTVARERRSALITAAVTGQIDVRGEVA